MREQEEACSTMIGKLKCQYNEAKNKGPKSMTLKQIRDHCKQALKLYGNKYTCLKKEIGSEYRDSSNTLSSGSNEDDEYSDINIDAYSSSGEDEK